MLNTAILSCDTEKPQLRTSARAKIEITKFVNMLLICYCCCCCCLLLNMQFLSTANITWVVFNKSAHRVGWNIWHFSSF